VSERPRDVFDDVCAELAARLADVGFTYAAKRHALSRRQAAWTHRLAFQSSHSNIAGHVVKLWCHVVVENASLKKWRAANSSPFLERGGRVAGGGTWNLGGRPADGIDWNLADATQRAGTVESIHQAIVTHALPFMEMASDPSGLSRRVMAADVPLVELADVVETALCLLEPSVADSVLSQWMLRHGDVIHEARQVLERLRAGGPVGRHRESYACQIALLVFTHALPASEAAVTAAPSPPAR
jgi:hypothetical protein